MCTSGGGGTVKTAVAAASASTSEREAGAKIVEMSRTRQQKSKRERKGRGGIKEERMRVEYENSVMRDLGTWRVRGGEEQANDLKTSSPVQMVLMRCDKECPQGLS